MRDRHQRLRFALFAMLMVVVYATGARADERRPISVVVAGETLAKALPPVGRSAGVKLRSGLRAQDRRLFLFVDSQPYAAVIEELKRFVPAPPGGAVYAKDGDTWVFDEDADSRSKRISTARKRQQQAFRQRQDRFDQMTDWSQPHDGDLRGMASGRQQLRRAQGIFAGLPPHAKQAALAGRPVNVPYTGLTPAAQALVHEWVGRMRAGSIGSDTDQFNGLTDCPKVVVQMRQSGSPDRPAMRLELRLCRSQGVISGDLLNAPTWTNADGWDWVGGAKSYNARQRGPDDRKTVPELQKRISLTGGDDVTVEAVLQELALNSGLPLIGEYDPCFRTPVTRENGQRNLAAGAVQGRPLWEALDVVAKEFDLEWEFTNGWLQFRSPRTLMSWAGELDLSPPEPEPKDPQNSSKADARP